MNQRQLFQQHLAPTSPDPLALPITKAKGAILYDDSGREYLDLIGGISVCNVGHCHPKVIKAIEEQAQQYLHVMVYGEVIQSPQVAYAELLSQHLPEQLDSVYFCNSGAEAVEGAMKLAKRVTNRREIIACHRSYHGSTQGALSIIGDEYWRNAYRPLLPGIRHIWHNDFDAVSFITKDTACIILEPIQAEAGVKIPDAAWMQAIRQRCNETGTLLILDEIQTGFGRTGRLWAFEHFGIVPDVLLLAKALGGGMPLGAFISSRKNMQALAKNPILGHLTTFGGHPVCCAAGKAALEVVLEENLTEAAVAKEKLFRSLLQHPDIRELRSKGLLMALELQDFDKVKQVIKNALQLAGQRGKQGLFTDWFLFAPECIRMVPPLTITESEIKTACTLLLECLETVTE